MDVNSQQEKTRENISKLRKATKEVKAYKAREDLAQTVTMLNRGRLAVPRESDPKNSKQEFVAGRAWSSSKHRPGELGRNLSCFCWILFALYNHGEHCPALISLYIFSLLQIGRGTNNSAEVRINTGKFGSWSVFLRPRQTSLDKLCVNWFSSSHRIFVLL